MHVKYELSEELRGPDVIPKHQRWENKDYLKFVSEMPCANCHIKDGTVVAHHLKGRFSPLSGGAGIKASDIFAMPLCYECHTKAHSGYKDILDWQHLFIMQTLDMATKHGILTVEYKPYESLIL